MMCQFSHKTGLLVIRTVNTDLILKPYTYESIKCSTRNYYSVCRA